MSKKFWIYIFLSIIAVIVLTFIYDGRLKIDDEPVIKVADKQSEDFGLSNAKTSSGEPVDPHLLPNSEDCAACHDDAYDEWSVSAHARSAANDPIYENHEETFAVRELGDDAITFCAGCHTPEALVTGSVGAAKWASSKNEQAGTSCVVCHTIGEVFNDKIQGVPADASYVITPERVQDYPFNNEKLETLQHTLIRSAPQRHAADLSSKLYGEAKYCSTCHTQAAPNGKIEQDTYREWLDSPYSDANSEEFATCITCHMAPVPGEPETQVAGKTTERGKTKHNALSHRFVGSNQALPYLYGDQEMFDLTEKMLRSAASIKVVDVVKNEKELAFKVQVTNDGAGHNLPTGATDLRQLWLDIEVLDQAGNVIFTSGKLDDKLEVDPNAVMFHSKFYDAEGNLIDHHQVWRIERREDNLIPPKQSKYGEYSLKLAEGMKEVTINAKLRYRITPQYFANVTLRKWGEPGTDRSLPITDIDKAMEVISLD